MVVRESSGKQCRWLWARRHHERRWASTSWRWRRWANDNDRRTGRWSRCQEVQPDSKCERAKRAEPPELCKSERELVVAILRPVAQLIRRRFRRSIRRRNQHHLQSQNRSANALRLLGVVDRSSG